MQLGQSNSLKIDMTYCFYTGTVAICTHMLVAARASMLSLRKASGRHFVSRPAATASRSG
jgi:hypothetical protein